jgi:hypothetical protein
MDWTKPDPAVVERFYGALPDDPLIERKKMFGYPAAFVNGNYFIGMHGDGMVARLPGDIRLQVPELRDAGIFDPRGTGKGMKDWYELPAALTGDGDRLADVIAALLPGVAALPPKVKKPPKPRKTP